MLLLCDGHKLFDSGYGSVTSGYYFDPRGRIHTESVRRGEGPRFSPVERQNFRASQIVRPIGDLPAAVHGIADGTMKLGPCSVGYIDGSGQPGTEMRCSFNEWTASFVAAYDLWSCHSLVGYGSSIRDVVREAGHDPLELDGMIRGGPNPYDGLPDLARRFCGKRQELEAQGDSTVVELVAPLARPLPRSTSRRRRLPGR